MEPLHIITGYCKSGVSWIVKILINVCAAFCGTSKAPWSFFAINVRKYFSILGGSASFPWWFSFVFIFCLFLAVNKVDIRLSSIPSTSAYNIYFTFQFIIFERHSFENNNETNIFLRSSDIVEQQININDDRNYCSTILHVKVRTKYAEVNILEEGSAIKLNPWLNIDLASSLNLIWEVNSFVGVFGQVGLICIDKLSPLFYYS